jgi:3-methyladenine DNA glycosylase AlkD
MLHPQKARLIEKAAADARRELKRLAQPSGDFDASRYFRGGGDLRFHNVGTKTMRALARSIYTAHRDEWSIDEAMAFASLLIADPYLEVKSLGIEVVVRYRRDFAPRLLPMWKRWLARDQSTNWATTDAISCFLIGPLLLRHPELAPGMRAWARHRNMWVRRAAAAGLIASVRKGHAMDVAYDVARQLHADPHDLIQKAVGWMLREAGKADPARLERYLRADGAEIPRTTVRYAIERFPESKRRALLKATKSTPSTGRGVRLLDRRSLGEGG